VDNTTKQMILAYWHFLVRRFLKFKQPLILVIHKIDEVITDRDIFNLYKNMINSFPQKNAIFVGSTTAQGASKLAAIIENCVTKIFLSNMYLDEKDYKLFNLTKKEQNTIKKIPPISRQFLLKQGNESIMTELSLTGLNDYLAILGGGEKEKELWNSIEEEDIEDKLEEFFNQVIDQMDA